MSGGVTSNPSGVQGVDVALGGVREEGDGAALRERVAESAHEGIVAAALQVFVLGSVVLEEDVVERLELAAIGVEHVRGGGR